METETNTTVQPGAGCGIGSDGAKCSPAYLCPSCITLLLETEQPEVEQPAMVTRPCPHCEVRTVTHRAGAVECSEVLCGPCLRDMGKPDPTDTACDCRRSDCGECAPMVRLHAFDGARTLPRWPGQ